MERSGPRVAQRRPVVAERKSSGDGAGRARDDGSISDIRGTFLRAFDRRVYDAELHYIMTFQWNRIVAHLSHVRGWTITPSHHPNNQLDTVWFTE